MDSLRILLDKAEQLAASIAKDLPAARAAIEEAEQQRTRAEAAEMELRELRKEMGQP